MMAPAVMHIDRVIPRVSLLELKPRENADADIDAIVIIAEVIVAVLRTGEQAELQVAEIDGDAECVGKTRARIDMPGKINRREQNPAARKRVIPVPVGKDIPARRPDVMRRYPYPVRLGRDPVAGPSNILSVIPVPARRHPHPVR